MSVNKDKVNRFIGKRGQFCQIPNELSGFPIHKKDGISAAAERIWLYLYAQAENWEPGQRFIAKQLRYSTGHIKKGLDALQNANMLHIIKPEKKGQRDKYILQSPDDWIVQFDLENSVNQEETLESVNQEETLFEESVNDKQTHIKRNNNKIAKLSKTEIEELEFQREDLINQWKESTEKEWNIRYESFLVILGNLKDTTNLERTELRIYEDDIMSHFIPNKNRMSKALKNSLKSRKIDYDAWKQQVQDDFKLAVTNTYSSVSLGDVEVKETQNASIVVNDEYEPLSNKVWTKEDLENVGEDDLGSMKDKLDLDFIEKMKNIGVDSE